jgi:hypothetical protein
MKEFGSAEEATNCPLLTRMEPWANAAHREQPSIYYEIDPFGAGSAIGLKLAEVQYAARVNRSPR